MAVLAGSLTLYPIYEDSSGFNDALDIHALPSFGGYLATVGAGAPLTNTQPVDEFPVALVGEYAHNFGFNDWFNRIHFSTLSVDLGNVVGAQSIVIRVWNAYNDQERALASLTADNAEGITMIEERAAPTSFGPLEELDYTIQVSTDGPAIIDASYTWDFDIVDVTVPIVGSRITAWLWQANGQVLERLEWRTDVIQSYDGDEQRVQVRGTPRRFFEHEILLEGAERRRAENALFGWGSRIYALPVWMDGEPLQANITAGDTAVTVSAEYRDYHADGLALVMTGSQNYEVFQIATVSTNSITLARPAENNWTASVAKIYPVRIARLQQEVGLNRFTGPSSYGVCQWSCADISDYAAASETTYRSYPVLDTKPNWVEDVRSSYARKLQILDFASAGFVVDDESSLPVLVQSHRWTLDGKAQIDDFRKWLYARKGRLAGFWLPSWADDLKILTSFGVSTTVFDVEHCGYTRQINGAIGRRDIRIALRNGQVYYRRITSWSEVDSDTESLTIDTTPGVAFTPADIALVSYVSFVRLDSDAAEIIWSRYDVAESSLLVRSMTNDV